MNKNDNAKEDDFKTQLSRLKSFFKKDSVDEVFVFLGIKKSAYTNYYNRNRLPKKFVNRLNIEHQLNPEWLLYGRGTQTLIPPPSQYHKGLSVIEPIGKYGSSTCTIICDAIHRRDEAHRELLVADILKYINSLDYPLAKDNQDTAH